MDVMYHSSRIFQGGRCPLEWLDWCIWHILQVRCICLACVQICRTWNTGRWKLSVFTSSLLLCSFHWCVDVISFLISCSAGQLPLSWGWFSLNLFLLWLLWLTADTLVIHVLLLWPFLRFFLPLRCLSILLCCTFL